MRAQERLTDAEYQYLSAQLTYNLSLMNLKRANGTLLLAEQVQINRRYDGCAPRYELEVTDFFAEEYVDVVYESVVAEEFSESEDVAPEAADYFEAP